MVVGRVQRATLTVALAAQTIDSIGRYGLLAVPLVVALARWSDRRWRQVLVSCVGSAGLVVWTAGPPGPHRPLTAAPTCPDRLSRTEG